MWMTGACYHTGANYHSALFTSSHVRVRFLTGGAAFCLTFDVWVILCHTLWKLRVDADESMVLSLPEEAASP